MKQLNKKLNEIKINNNDNQELQCENGRYVGQVVNGLREGKGICYWEDGDLCTIFGCISVKRIKINFLT